MVTERRYGIYVNGRHGGFTLKEAGRTLAFSTYVEAEAAIDARGYVQSTSVDRDSFGNHLKFRQVTAYVITVDTTRKEAQ